VVINKSLIIAVTIAAFILLGVIYGGRQVRNAPLIHVPSVTERQEVLNSLKTLNDITRFQSDSVSNKVTIEGHFSSGNDTVSPDEVVYRFLEEYKALFPAIDPRKEFKEYGGSKSIRKWYVQFYQHRDDIPVEGGYIRASGDWGVLYTLDFQYKRIDSISTFPLISKDQAILTAVSNRVAEKKKCDISTTSLLISTLGRFPRLAWHVSLNCVIGEPWQKSSADCYIDARNGALFHVTELDAYGNNISPFEN
jgi:hypothetical protein